MPLIQTKRMLALGIVFGLLPILISAIAHQSMLILIGPYLVGCYNDLKELIKQ
jgi:hypothetical protein